MTISEIKKIQKIFQYGKHTVTMETGEVARQATSAVMIDMDGTTVLVTLVAKKEAVLGQDFFPLTVNYQEKTYAGGRIPGGFYKREGRPSERETLISRLIDRPIRPLFADEFLNEVQIFATVLSINPEVESDIVAMIGASAAIALSGVPFNGPIAAARVGYKDGQFLLNPESSELESSELDMVVAGTEHAVLMVESEAQVLSEDVMLEAVWFGHEQMQVVIQAIKEFVEAAGGAKSFAWTKPVANEALKQTITTMVEADVSSAYQIKDKMERYNRLTEIKKQTTEKLCGEEEGKPAEHEVHALIENLEKTIVRSRILGGYPRIDGRDTRTIRPLSIKVGILSRTHGSALFTRGETQALVVTTLGTERDAQTVEGIFGESKDRFMLHYNFPPFCVGETGQASSPKRREIGHGRLARRSIEAVLPEKEAFPYVIRVVSEITESNGSSSMASVCGGCLSLMDAGVPIKAPVAGIAMGLIKEEKRFAILSDILGDEDHLGDMDFKVAGTATGVTALQMDIKIEGITKFIMKKALEQALEGRLYILSHMDAVIKAPRSSISNYAPSIHTYRINPEKIKDVIGKGGSVIRSITEETGASIDIQDDGSLSIAAVDGEAGKQAWQRIQAIVAEVEVGKIYQGKVVRIMEFGAFVNLLPGKDGFLHISQIADTRVNNITDYLHEGDIITVKAVEIDRQGRVRITMKPSEML